MRILLADDHPLYAEALGTLISRNVPSAQISVVPDAEAAHGALSAQEFDLVILDLHMPGMNGLDGVRSILARAAPAPLILISGAAAPAEVASAIALGAKGFVPKTLSSSVLVAALQVVMAGGTHVPTDYAMPPVVVPEANQIAGPLTPREAEVMAMLAAGRSNKEIGRALELQEITVKLHVRNIFRKLGVRNRVEAANVFSRQELDRLET